MKRGKPTITGNCIGRVFKCGCAQSSLAKPTRNKKWAFACKAHGATVDYKVFKCFDCGQFFKGKGKRAGRCPSCKQDHVQNAWRAKAEIKRAEREAKAEAGIVEEEEATEPSTEDHSERWHCKWGDYCMNRECFQGIKFDCNGCRRFELKELDIMDYTRAADACGAVV